MDIGYNEYHVNRCIKSWFIKEYKGEKTGVRLFQTVSARIGT